MKVLEAQVCLISNYEVYQQIIDTRAQNKAKKIRAPENLFNLQTQVLDYFRTRPGPLREQEEKQNYHDGAFDRLFERLEQENFRQKLTKGEAICICNIRPMSAPTLSGVIEDIENRFTEEEQNRIVEIIAEVLGSDDPREEEEEEGEGGNEGAEDGDEAVVEDGN
ncbi:RNA polymerase Rpb4-domain-containing protein [Cladorrhinum sp. PSN259]|nr:RNA polymerase Rpb4-domain-containing protein [Cladorrhinum sp. PSN259]